jgi:hypothetical protein
MTSFFIVGSQINPVRQNGPLTGFTQLTADDSGISVKRPLFNTNYRWDAIETASLEEAFVALWLEPCVVELIPQRAFSTPQERDAFYGFVIANLSNRAMTAA